MQSDIEQDPFGSRYADAHDGIHSKEMERDSLRLTYRISSLAFAILAIALALATMDIMVFLVEIFGGRQLVIGIRQQTWWKRLDVPIVWGSLAGVYLLWGRSTARDWQRKAGGLLVMSLVDAGLVLLKYAGQLGITAPIGHEYFRESLGQALAWPEFMLIASLACDFMARLGVDRAAEASKSTRSLAITGAFLWTMHFVMTTNWEWKQLWPLRPLGMLNRNTLLLFIGTHMIWATLLVQVTAMTFAASRRASRVLAQMKHEDMELDQFSSRHDEGGFGAGRDETHHLPRH